MDNYEQLNTEATVFEEQTRNAYNQYMEGRAKIGRFIYYLTKLFLWTTFHIPCRVELILT